MINQYYYTVTAFYSHLHGLVFFRNVCIFTKSNILNNNSLPLSVFFFFYFIRVWCVIEHNFSRLFELFRDLTATNKNQCFNFQIPNSPNYIFFKFCIPLRRFIAKKRIVRHRLCAETPAWINVDGICTEHSHIHHTPTVRICIIYRKNT